jgi:hypothetical protein
LSARPSVQIKGSNDIVTTENNGNTHVYKADEMIGNNNTDNSNADNNQNKVFSTLAANTTPSGYSYNTKAYNKGIKRWGYLYSKKLSTVYGHDTRMKFSKGTKISAIVTAIISGGVLLFTDGVAAVVPTVLKSLGASFAESSLASAVDGYVKAKKIKWSYIVKSNNKVGLKTTQTRVYYKTHKKDYKYLKTVGDSRTKSTLCIEGAYNVYIRG